MPVTLHHKANYCKRKKMHRRGAELRFGVLRQNAMQFTPIG